MNVDFRPSQAVRYDYRNSALQNGEQEAFALMFAAFLAQNGDEWKEVSWEGLHGFIHAHPPQNIHPLLPRLLRGQLGQQAISFLVREGYFTLREEGYGFLMATPKLIEFYRSYAQQ